MMSLMRIHDTGTSQGNADAWASERATHDEDTALTAADEATYHETIFTDLNLVD